MGNPPRPLDAANAGPSGGLRLWGRDLWLRWGALHRTERWLYAVAGAVLVGQLALLALPMDVLLRRLLADDAYYYHALVQNVLAGKGIVFNEGIPTNGFHPLYAVLLVPIHAILGPLGPDAPVRGSLALLSLLHVVTGVLLYHVARHLAGRRSGLVAAGLWLINPAVLFTTWMGLETGLQATLVAATILYILTREDRTRLSTREAVGLGVLLAATFLARMDAAALVVGVFGVMTWERLAPSRAAPDEQRRGNLWTRCRDLAVSAGAAGALVAPWLVWTYVAVGRITPVSGDALRALRLRRASRGELAAEGLYRVESLVSEFLIYPSYTSWQVHLVIAVVLVLPLAYLAVKRSRELAGLVGRLDFLVVAATIYYAYYVLYAGGLREWYGHVTFLFLTLLLAWMLPRLADHAARPGAVRGGLAVCLALAFVASGAARYADGNFPQEQLKREVAAHIDEHVPAEGRIGSFNTGIYQYYTPSHDVENLDGVMNPEAYRALSTDQREAYILELGLEYLVDPPALVATLDREQLALEEVTRFQMTVHRLAQGEITITYALYRVSPASGL